MGTLGSLPFKKGYVSNDIVHQSAITNVASMDCLGAECTKRVGYDEPVIRCDTCDKWWHTCCGGLSDAQCIALEVDKSSAWHCPTWLQLLRNDVAPKVPPIRLKQGKGKWKVNNAPPRPTNTKASSIQKKETPVISWLHQNCEPKRQQLKRKEARTRWSHRHTSTTYPHHHGDQAFQWYCV